MATRRFYDSKFLNKIYKKQSKNKKTFFTRSTNTRNRWFYYNCYDNYSKTIFSVLISMLDFNKCSIKAVSSFSKNRDL